MRTPSLFAVILRHSAGFYARCTLSLRDVEESLAERGLDDSYEAVRRWFMKIQAELL